MFLEYYLRIRIFFLYEKVFNFNSYLWRYNNNCIVGESIFLTYYLNLFPKTLHLLWPYILKLIELKK